MQQPYLDEIQMSTVQKMRNGCILKGDVGSGKSRAALYYYFSLCGGSFENGIYIPMTSQKSLYIITTARKRDTLEWEKEMVPLLLYPDKEGFDIHIDSWNNIKKYVNTQDAFFIFDEDRVVGKGVWVKTFLKIVKSNLWILLTATPGDKWSDYIPVFIANGYYRNRTEFEREHAVYKRIGNYPVIDHYVNTGKLVKLRKHIIVEMPVKRHTTQHHIDISCAYDKEKYLEVSRKRWNIFTNSPIANASEFCQCLRKIVNTDWSRMEAVLDILDKHGRVIVFYNYDYELSILRAYMYGDIIGEIEVAEWNGHKHEPIPNSEKWVYLVQYAAGSEGWNCTETNALIFFSQNYSYRTMVQASGRIDRRNTPFVDLYYYHLKSKAKIDLAIERALIEKKKFNETTFYEKFLS